MNLKEVKSNIDEYFDKTGAEEIYKKVCNMGEDFKHYVEVFDEESTEEDAHQINKKGVMDLLLVKYFEDFYYGELDGLFVCTEGDLEKLKGKNVYFGEVLGEHSDVVSNTAYRNCHVVSEDFDLIRDLECVFGGKNISGYNPLDYIEKKHKRRIV